MRGRHVHQRPFLRRRKPRLFQYRKQAIGARHGPTVPDSKRQMHGERLLEPHSAPGGPAPCQYFVPSLATGSEELASFFMRIDEGSERGHVGDPTVASAEKGERMLSAIVDSLIEVVEDILADRLWSRLIEPLAGFARGELRRSL